MKRFLKILGVSVLSLAIVVASCFIPMKLKQSETSLSKASAASTPSISIPPVTPDGDFTTSTGINFIGSDLFVVNTMSMTANTLVTDFQNYISNGVYDAKTNNYLFQFSFGIGLNNMNFAVNALSSYSSLKFLKSPNSTFADSSEYGILQSVVLSDISITMLQDGFIANDIFNYSTFTPMYSCRYGNATVGYMNFGFQIYRNNTETEDFVMPTYDMQYLVLCSYSDVQTRLGLPYDNKFIGSNVFCYVDTAGYYYLIYICGGNTDNIYGQSYFFNYRRYILKQPDFSDNDYYQQGVNDGYTNGYNKGESAGYRNGFNAGEDEGFTAGYIEGLNTADTFTFYNLIGAVFDAPLDTFTSLFNFEILGVNILSFLSSILTLCIVIWLVKLVLGGK